MKYYLVIEEGNPVICEMHKPWGHYNEWNKSERGRQMLYELIYVQSTKSKFIETNHKLVAARDVGGISASYKVNKIRDYNVQHSDCS